jgi:hypothetical protein
LKAEIEKKISIIEKYQKQNIAIERMNIKIKIK